MDKKNFTYRIGMSTSHYAFRWADMGRLSAYCDGYGKFLVRVTRTGMRYSYEEADMDNIKAVISGYLADYPTEVLSVDLLDTCDEVRYAIPLGALKVA